MATTLLREKSSRCCARQLLDESYDKRFTPSFFIEENSGGFSVGWFSVPRGYECVKRFSNLADAATDYLYILLGQSSMDSARNRGVEVRRVPCPPFRVDSTAVPVLSLSL